MTYHAHITKAAERDVINASDYIDLVLKNPAAADSLLDEFESKVNALIEFPQQHPLVEDDLLSAWGIRFVMVKNYLAFYLVEEETATVFIIRFLYGKSNWLSILKSGFSMY